MEAMTTPTEVLEAEGNLRDQFAMAAMTGLCAQHDAAGMWSWMPDTAAQWAYKMADEMLLARVAIAVSVAA